MTRYLDCFPAENDTLIDLYKARCFVPTNDVILQNIDIQHFWIASQARNDDSIARHFRLFDFSLPTRNDVLVLIATI